jgi:hypothetical protein
MAELPVHESPAAKRAELCRLQLLSLPPAGPGSGHWGAATSDHVIDFDSLDTLPLFGRRRPLEPAQVDI